VSPLISSSQKLTTFFAHRFIAFYCFHSGITALEGVTLHLFYLSDLVSPLFFVNLPTKIFFILVSHPWRVSPGAVCHPPPPSDATAQTTPTMPVLVSCRMLLSSVYGSGLRRELCAHPLKSSSSIRFRFRSVPGVWRRLRSNASVDYSFARAAVLFLLYVMLKPYDYHDDGIAQDIYAREGRLSTSILKTVKLNSRLRMTPDAA